MNPTRLSPTRRQVVGLGLLAIAFACTGCGAPGAADPTEGRTALLAALDAWKEGGRPEDLASKSPAIHVADGDWKSGMVLRDYRADGEGKLVGSDLNYSVSLELKNARGKVTKKTAVYSVITSPQVLVLRQDD